jgi:ribosomal protein S18 acetylase RimI-like enzyme
MQALFRGSEVFVAEDSGLVAGFGGSRGSFITWLFVHPAFRRKGIATALILFMLGRLSKPVTLNVMTNNAPARALYEGIGFNIVREFQGSFQGNPCSVAN